MPRIKKYKADYYDLFNYNGYIMHGLTPVFMTIVTSMWINEYIEYLKNNDNEIYFNFPDLFQMPKFTVLILYEKENNYAGFRGIVQIKEKSYTENPVKIFKDKNYNLASAKIESISIFKEIVELKKLNMIYSKDDKCNTDRGFMSKYLLNLGVHLISQCLGIKLLKNLHVYTRHNYIFELKKIEKQKEIEKILLDIERSRSEKIKLDDIVDVDIVEDVIQEESSEENIDEAKLMKEVDHVLEDYQESDSEDDNSDEEENAEEKEEMIEDEHKQGLIPILTVKCEDFKFPVIKFDKSEIDKFGNTPDDYAKIKYYISHTLSCEKCITVNNNQIEFASLLFESYDSMYMKKLEDSIDVLNAKKHYQSCKKYNPFGEVSKNSIMILDVERNILASEYRSYANTIFVIVVRKN